MAKAIRDFNYIQGKKPYDKEQTKRIREDFGDDYKKGKEPSCRLLGDDDIDVIRKRFKENAKTWFILSLLPWVAMIDYLNRVIVPRKETQRDPEDPDREPST